MESANKVSSELLSCVLHRHVRPHLGHLALTVSGQERHVVDLVHHDKVLLLPLKVLLRGKRKNNVKKKKKDKEKRCREKKRKLTCDLDQKMKTSPTILKSSSASGSGQVSHLALQVDRETGHMAASERLLWRNPAPQNIHRCEETKVSQCVLVTCCCPHSGSAAGTEHTGPGTAPQTHRGWSRFRCRPPSCLPFAADPPRPPPCPLASSASPWWG